MIKIVPVISKFCILILVCALLYSCAKKFDTSYNNVTLKIDSIVPAYGTAGTPVRIYGAGFTTQVTDNAIKFNGLPATIDSSNTNTIGVLLVYAPANGSTGNVSVVNRSGSAVGPIFTYVQQGPVISSISPFSGQAGTQVTITGSNFVGDTSKNAVYFNGVQAAVVSAAANQLVVIAPASTTGNVSVTTNGLTGTGPVFTYVIAPVITNISRGNFFTITGTNFDPQNSVVTIGGQTVGGFTYANNGNNIQTLSLISSALPSNLGNPDYVTVTVNGVTSNAFQFLFPPQINKASSDTVINGSTLNLQGIFFGNRSVSSSVNAFYYIGQNQTALTPDPVIVSWDIISIQLTVPNYDSYALNRYLPIYVQINVGTYISIIQIVYDSQK